MGQAPESQQKALSVRAYNVTLKPISTYVIANTTLEAIRDVIVYSRLNAMVVERTFEEGDVVREGQVLARLDDREIKNEFEQATIAVEQAQLSLKQADVRARLSKTSYERAQSLFEQKLTSQEEFDQSALASRTDALSLDNASQQLEAAKARLEAARIQLDYTTVTSPISGVITQRQIDVGERVNPGEALFSVQEFPPLWARIFVPEKSLPSVRIGQLAQLKVETYPDQQFDGHIKMISPTVDVSSGTVKVTIEVNRPGKLLRPGMFGTVHIATETHNDAVVIPKKAILRERDQNYVFVIQADNKVSRREVSIGFSEDNRVEILSGVQAGETIVTVGVETLSDGYPVVAQSFEKDSGEIEVNTAPAPAVETEAVQTASTERPGPPAQAQMQGQWSGPQGDQQRGAMFERMMQNPEIRKKWEDKVKEDPSIAEDPQKRREFFREVMADFRSRASN